MTMIKKPVSEIQEDDIIMINDLPCKVLAVELSPTGKTAKVFYAINGDANFLRCSINSKLTIAPEPEDKPLKIFPEKNNIVPFRKSFPESRPEDLAEQFKKEMPELSEFYREMHGIVSKEYQEIHDFYLKHILGMPALVRKSIEIALTETNSAKQHLQEKHLKELGYPMERTEKSD